MPGWQPEWADVELDRVAASAAATACDAAADRARVAANDLTAAAGPAVEDWTGGARRDFDDATARIDGDLATTAAALDALADAIRDAAAAAGAEQQRREDERDRWRAERAAEEDARRAELLRPGPP
jgi:uncharacterized protein YukE